MLNAKYIEPEYCGKCGSYHEPEYPHLFTGLFEVNFVNEHKREPTMKDTYSHCKGLVFECAEVVHKNELNYGNRPASGGGINNTGSKGFRSS